MQQIMRWGHDFLRIRGWAYSNLWANGENPNVKGRTHQNCQLSFLSHSLNHLLLPEIGWVGYCMGWAMYDSPNSNWRSHQFLGNTFLLLWEEKTQKRRPFYQPFHVGMFSSPFFLHVSSLGHPKLPMCVFIPRFWLLASFSHGWEVVFVMPEIGLVFLTFLELLVHFPLSPSCFCLPHA